MYFRTARGLSGCRKSACYKNTRTKRICKWLSNDALLLRLSKLVKQSRRVESVLVAHIAEVDGRRLYADQAMPSMHKFCTDVLHLSDAEAYLRIEAARTSRRYPALLTMLEDGRLHLSGIGVLAPLLKKLDRAVGAALLTRGIHKSKRELKVMVAELEPKPDVPPSIRKVRESRRQPERETSSENELPAQQSTTSGRSSAPTAKRGRRLVVAVAVRAFSSTRRCATIGPDMPLASGTKLGQYEVVEAIGAGGMGEVYRARDTKLGREVAIKVLLEELSKDRERLARFEREAKLLASLNHPAIATLHGFEDDFIVMELVEGETLAERVARGPIPIDEVAASLHSNHRRSRSSS